MKEYKIKYLNEIPAFKTIKKELKGLPGLGQFSKLCYAGVQILVQKSDSELVLTVNEPPTKKTLLCTKICTPGTHFMFYF